MDDDRVNRFWAKVSIPPDVVTGCWLWTSQRINSGYGRFRGAPRKWVLAHRLAYEQVKGPIPDGLALDHLCRVRHCVNPAHLEPVTNRENTHRSPLVIGNTYSRGQRFTRGVLNGNAKLSETDVREIRRLALSTDCRLLAERFGLHIRQIFKIVARQQWKHIP